MSNAAHKLTGVLKNALDMCFYPLTASHYIKLVNPLWASHLLQARIESVVDETADTRTLTLRPGRGWRAHRAGQYIRVGVDIEGRRYTRTYSLSSAPRRADGLITITVKAQVGGRVSNYLVREATPGTLLAIGLPQGDFVLPETEPVRPLFITAGSGITPVMAMLRDLASRGLLRDVVHIHYARTAAEVIFRDELRSMVALEPRFKLHILYTQVGTVAENKAAFSGINLNRLCPDWHSRQTWACGPASLMGVVKKHWEENRLSGRLYTEYFRATLAPANPGAGGRMVFTRSRCAVEVDGGTSILRAAEDAGLNPQHGCRMGICHSCDVKLVKGSVCDMRTGQIVNAEAGTTVQICVCTAAGDSELEL